MPQKLKDYSARALLTAQAFARPVDNEVMDGFHAGHSDRYDAADTYVTCDLNYLDRCPLALYQTVHEEPALGFWTDREYSWPWQGYVVTFPFDPSPLIHSGFVTEESTCIYGSSWSVGGSLGLDLG